MLNKKFVKFFLIFLLFIIINLLIYFKFLKNEKNEETKEETTEINYNSNLIKDVKYSTKDQDGNEYLIKAKEGEIDFSNPNIIFLKDVDAQIQLNNSDKVTIVSDFGKYNSENYDTIFSKNVIINYLDNKITGGYLDFSLERNSMIISKNVHYHNTNNLLKADVVEININTKNTKIFMYENKKKVYLESKE